MTFDSSDFSRLKQRLLVWLRVVDAHRVDVQHQLNRLHDEVRGPSRYGREVVTKEGSARPGDIT